VPPAIWSAPAPALIRSLPEAADDHIAVAAGADDVRAITADDRVVAGAGDDGVVAESGADQVVAAQAEDGVVAVAGDDEVGAGGAAEHVVAGGAEDRPLWRVGARVLFLGAGRLDQQ